MQVQYDPALYIGCIIDKTSFKNLATVSALYAEIASKKSEINNMMRTAEEIKLITKECITSGFYDEKTGISDAEKDLKEIQKIITNLKKEYLQVSVKNLQAISKIKTASVTQTIESPCDWTKTQIKTDFPISADTIKVDSSYFTFDENTQSADQHISSVMSFVDTQFSELFGSDSGSFDGSKKNRKSMSHTHQHHRVKSTLVITAMATHKNATMFAPCVFDVEKLVNCWNSCFTKEWLDAKNPVKMKELYKKSEKSSKIEKSHLNFVSGATYGSGLVGLVTFTDDSETNSSQKMEAMAESFKSAFKVAAFFGNVTGDFGFAKQEANSLKDMMSNQTIGVHFNMYCAGLIPTISSNIVEFGVKEFADFDPGAMEKQLVQMQNMTSGSSDSVDQGADASRTANQIQSLANNKVEAVLSSLQNIKESQDSVLNVNTMMTAFDNYAKMAAAGNIGVPMNYFVKPIYKSDIVELWMKKYFPTAMWGEKKQEEDGHESDHSKAPSEASGKNADL